MTKRNAKELWEAMMEGEPEVDESVLITSSMVNQMMRDHFAGKSGHSDEKRAVATAKAQYEHELGALEGKWDETTDLIRNIYIESAEVGLSVADEIMFSDATLLRVSKVLFNHHVSDGAGETAPEIMNECESAAHAVIAALKRIASE